MTSSPLTVGDEVVIESNVLPSGEEGWLGSQIIGETGVVEDVTDQYVYAAGYELAPESFVKVSDLDALAAERAPRVAHRVVGNDGSHNFEPGTIVYPARVTFFGTLFSTDRDFDGEWAHWSGDVPVAQWLAPGDAEPVRDEPLVGTVVDRVPEIGTETAIDVPVFGETHSPDGTYARVTQMSTMSPGVVDLFVHDPVGDALVCLTAEQARQVADALTAAADIAEAQRGA